MKRYPFLTLLAGFALGLLLVLVYADCARAASSVTLTWTAPGDDGMVGRATSYEGRWSSVQPDTTNMAAWWSVASIIPMPVPAAAGATETLTYAPSSGFTDGVMYYFAVRTFDDAGNSTFSNVARRIWTDVTPPARVTDLRAN